LEEQFKPGPKILEIINKSKEMVAKASPQEYEKTPFNTYSSRRPERNKEEGQGKGRKKATGDTYTPKAWDLTGMDLPLARGVKPALLARYVYDTGYEIQDDEEGTEKRENKAHTGLFQ
jgi:hypothetical protein